MLAAGALQPGKIQPQRWVIAVEREGGPQHGNGSVELPGLDTLARLGLQGHKTRQTRFITIDPSCHGFAHRWLPDQKQKRRVSCLTRRHITSR